MAEEQDLLVPTGGGNGDKSLFGKLVVTARKVSGIPAGGYTVPGVEFDGVPTVFMPKASPEAGYNHILMVMEVASKDGNPYKRAKGYVSFDDRYTEEVYPSMRDNGVKDGVPVFAKITIKDTDEKPDGYENTIKYWVVDQTFATEQAMKKASDAFFARFGGNGGGAAAGGYGVLTAIPESWVGSEALFVETVLTALEGKPAPTVPDFIAVNNGALAGTATLEAVKQVWENRGTLTF